MGLVTSGWGLYPFFAFFLTLHHPKICSDCTIQVSVHSGFHRIRVSQSVVSARVVYISRARIIVRDVHIRKVSATTITRLSYCQRCAYKKG